MKKIILSVLFLVVVSFAGNCYASGIQSILQKKIINYSDIKIINKLVNEHAPFSVADLRRLIRDYRGNKGKYISGHTNYNHHFLPVSANIERERALAYIVYKILKNYPNVYNNINNQGRHYQTALFIACRLHLNKVILALLKDKKINTQITSLGHLKSNLGYNKSAYFNEWGVYLPKIAVVSLYPITAYDFIPPFNRIVGNAICKTFKFTGSQNIIITEDLAAEENSCHGGLPYYEGFDKVDNINPDY